MTGQPPPGGTGVDPAWGPPVAGPAHGWGPPPVPWGGPAPARSAMPERPQPYHHLWRAPRWRWWKSILLLGVGTGLLLLLQFAAVAIALVVDYATGTRTGDALSNGEVRTTPALFIFNNISLAVLVLLVPLWAWAVTGQRPGWMSSVVGRIRWGWLGRCLAWIAPIWLILTVVQAAASWGDPGMRLRWQGDSLVMIVAIVITTPLQSAGEEYAFRGIVNRSIASWFPSEKIGMVAGMLVSAGAFTWAHSAQDGWLNLFYFCFGMLSAWLVYRTGGLEASIAMHLVNNLTAEWTLPFTDISGLFDRQAGSAGPGVLVNILVPLIAVALIEWQAHRHQVVRRYQPVPSGTAALELPPATGGWSASLMADASRVAPTPPVTPPYPKQTLPQGGNGLSGPYGSWPDPDPWKDVPPTDAGGWAPPPNRP